MTLSVFDIFKVGIGPSSSHTMGPMQAAREFVLGLKRDGLLERHRARSPCASTARLRSPAAATAPTARCSRDSRARSRESVDPDSIEPTLQRIRTSGRLRLLGEHEIAFDEPMQLLFMHHERLPRHSNGMRFTRLDGRASACCARRTTTRSAAASSCRGDEAEARETRMHAAPPYPFSSGDELLRLCREHGLEMYELMLANETHLAPPARGAHPAAAHLAGDAGLRARAASARRGLLPGVLKVRRRAPRLYRMLTESGTVKPAATSWTG